MNTGSYIPVAGMLGDVSKENKCGITDGGNNLILMSFEELSARNARIAQSIKE